MANQNPYQIQGQNKGTLVPGQSIAVGQFNVQVERYLSQGKSLETNSTPNMQLESRWIRACISRQNSDARVQHDASCLEAYSSRQRGYAHRSQEGSRCDGTCFVTLWYG